MDEAPLLAEIPRLRRYARALVGDRAAADDLVQDTLERAWSRRRTWQDDRPLRPWLFSIMHNLRLDQLRRPGIAPQPLDERIPEPGTRPTQSDALELADLAAALYRLPEEQRAVILLVALEDMSYDAIAQTLAIPRGTVMSRLFRGREHLRRLMAPESGITHLRLVP